MLSWRNDQVLLWLKNSNQPDDILDIFRVHNITGLTLPMLNSEELKEMGISNLRQRLQLLNDISTLIIEKNPHLNTINLNNEHPLLNELQTIVLSTNLVKNISKGIVEESSSQLVDMFAKKGEMNDKENSENSFHNKEYKSLLTKINKLREEMLPILKDIHDKKPLPAPTPNPNISSFSNHNNNNINNNITHSGMASPSRTMFVSNRKSSSDTLASTFSPERVHSPINSPINSPIPTSNSSSQINLSHKSPPLPLPLPQQEQQQQQQQESVSSAAPITLSHKNSIHRTHSQHKSQNNLSKSSNTIPTSRSFQRLSTQNQTSHDTVVPSISSQQQQIQKTSNNSASSDTLKQLRAKTEDPCYKILQAAMRSHKLDKSAWRNYVLIICYGGDKERVLRYDEKPVVVFKELNELGLSPSMMLRQVEETDDTGYGNYEDYETPGGRL